MALENYVLPGVAGCLPALWRPNTENHRLARGKCRNRLPCGTTIHLATDEPIPTVEALEGALTRLVRPAPETQRQSD
jgi:hypothetical protein